jgi:hypothetical protein
LTGRKRSRLKFVSSLDELREGNGLGSLQHQM